MKNFKYHEADTKIFVRICHFNAVSVCKFSSTIVLYGAYYKLLLSVNMLLIFFKVWKAAKLF